jgi:hypothetical protein
MFEALQGPIETSNQMRDVEPMYGGEALKEVLPMLHKLTIFPIGADIG